jgi:hypothetical protein
MISSPLGEKSGAEHLVMVAAQSEHLFTSILVFHNLPYVGCEAASTSQHSAVSWAKFNAGNPMHVTAQVSPKLTEICIPNQYVLITSTGGYEPAITAECDWSSTFGTT